MNSYLGKRKACMCFLKPEFNTQIKISHMRSFKKMESISERTYKWRWAIKAQVQFVHCLPEKQELQSWPERTTFNCTSWPLLTWFQIYQQGSWGSTVVHVNLKPSVCLLCMRQCWQKEVTQKRSRWLAWRLNFCLLTLNLHTWSNYSW